MSPGTNFDSRQIDKPLREMSPKPGQSANRGPAIYRQSGSLEASPHPSDLAHTKLPNGRRYDERRAKPAFRTELGFRPTGSRRQAKSRVRDGLTTNRSKLEVRRKLAGERR